MAGFEVWLAEPQPGDLAWAGGTVPTPRGAISVQWSRQAAGFVVRVEVPPGTHGYVGAPIEGATPRLEVSGRPVARAALPSGLTRRGYAYVGPLPAASHAVSMSSE